MLVRIWEYLQEDDSPDLAVPPALLSLNERVPFQRAVKYYEETMNTKFSVQ